jgi:acetoin utilization protein AcuC
MSDFAVLFRKEINEYDFGENHPFHGRKGEIFLNFFKEKINTDFPIIESKKSDDNDLLLICEKEYIEFTKNYFRAKYEGKDFDGKFFLFHSLDNLPQGKPGNIEEAARYIIGQAKLASDLVMQKKFKKVISIGGGLHHAKKNFGEGFCLYNDVAFCAKYLIKKYGLKRILILDTDAHAGNGTLEYFYDNPKVLFIDLHQDPKTLYPGTGFVEQKGTGKGKGFKINIPLPVFSGDLSYKMVFEEIIEPVVKEYKPEIIIRNGGSDPHFSDPLTNLGLTIKGFKIIGEKVRDLSLLCEGREIDLIASGYNLEILNYCWTALLSSILGIDINLEEPFQFEKIKEPIEEVKFLIQKIKKEFQSFWQNLR